MSSSSGSTANANANTDGGATRIDDDNSDNATSAAVFCAHTGPSPWPSQSAWH